MKYTPAAKAGYCVGDRGTTNTFLGNGTFILYEDDGSHIPLWKLVEGTCAYNHADGEKGAYIALDAMKKEGDIMFILKSIAAIVQNKVLKMLGCFLRFTDFIMTNLLGGVYTFYERYSIWRMVNYKEA